MIEQAGVRFAGRAQGRARRGRPDRAPPARRHGRRDPVDGDVPLDRRPSRRCSGNLAAVAASRAGSWSPNAEEPGTSRRSTDRLARWVTRSAAGRLSRRRRRPRPGWRRPASTDIETWLHDEPTIDPAGGSRSVPGDRVPGWHRRGHGRRRTRGLRRTRSPPGCREPRIDYVRLNIRARRAAERVRSSASAQEAVDDQSGQRARADHGQHLPSEAPQPHERHGRHDQREDVER